MFEREIQFIYDFSHNKIKKLDSFITFSELKSTNLHPAILQYISAEIDFYIFEDRQKLLKDSLFDYSGNKVNSYFLQISDEIKKTKKFSQSYIEKLILHSVTFTVNHLVSPNSLVTQFIFEEDKEKSATEIKQILNYLYYYPHIKKIISSYLDKKNLIKITSEEFRELLKKIDSIGLQENLGKIYNEALNSMADFFNIGMSGRVLIPLVAVQNYLKDKKLDNHLEKLQSEFVDAEVTRYEIKDYQKVVVSLEADELKPLKEVETEEVLESDLVDETLQSNSFEPVEEEEQISEKEDSSVDIIIMGDESNKVILDEEPITEIEAEEHIETISEKITDQTVNQENEVTGKIAEDEEISETAAPEEDLIESPEDKVEEILDNSPGVDSEIFEREDERELEHETVAEVMELAKEELEIAADEDSTDEKIEDKEIEAEEKIGVSIEVNEDIEKQSDNIFKDATDTKELYIDETGYEEDKEVDEKLAVPEKELSVEEILNEKIHEENISYINDDEDSIQFKEETVKDESVENPETDDELEQEKELDNELNEALDEEVKDENNMEEIGPVISDNTTEEDIDLSESDTESIDTLSYLLNEDFADSGMEEENTEDEGLNKVDDNLDEDGEELKEVAENLNEDDGELIEIDDNLSENGEELIESDDEQNDVDEETESDENLLLFEEAEDSKSEEEESEISLDADAETAVEEESEVIADSNIDITFLLENKKMSKIIDIIFDYDMEEFASAIEQIGEASDLDNANNIIDKVCKAYQISVSSREAKLFKSIIYDYYNRK